MQNPEIDIIELRAMVEEMERIDQPDLTLKAWRALHALLGERHRAIVARE